MNKQFLALILCAMASAAMAQGEIPLTDGEGWLASSKVEKTAYIVGANDLLVVEYITQQKNNAGLTKEESSVQGYWDGLEGETIEGLIETIDSFYENNPESMETPVMVVIWNSYVEPEN